MVGEAHATFHERCRPTPVRTHQVSVVIPATQSGTGDSAMLAIPVMALFAILSAILSTASHSAGAAKAAAAATVHVTSSFIVARGI